MNFAATDVYIKCKEESGCFSNWGNSATGCFPKDITWKCTNTGFSLTGSLSALYEHSNLLTPAQKLGTVLVSDTIQVNTELKMVADGKQTYAQANAKINASAKTFKFKSNGNVTIEQTWADLNAKPVHVKDKNLIQFMATISPATPIVANSK